jgi:hypothetical protein
VGIRSLRAFGRLLVVSVSEKEFQNFLNSRERPDALVFRLDVSLGRLDGRVVSFFISFPTTLIHLNMILEQKVMIKILRCVHNLP